MTSNGDQARSGAALGRLRERLELESSESRQMLYSPCDNPIVTIAVRQDEGFIEVVWRRYATSAQLRFVHETLIELMRSTGVGKLLGDDTHVQMVHDTDRRWVCEDWRPRAVDAGLVAIASREPAGHFGRTSVDAVIAQLSSRLAVRSFPERGQAEAWLRSLS